MGIEEKCSKFCWGRSTSVTILSMSSMYVLPPCLSSRRYPFSFHEFSIHGLYLHINLYTIFETKHRCHQMDISLILKHESICSNYTKSVDLGLTVYEDNFKADRS